jgi:LuxR family maltose regulon positive regulatory protein
MKVPSMPRYALSQLRWAEQAQTYVLFIGEQESRQALTSDWLEQIASFSFHSRSGMHYTVRKQKVQRGSSYWYAYRRLHGRIIKRYLGRTADLTFARLEEIARLLESESDSRQLSFQPYGETVLPQRAPDVSRSEDARRACLRCSMLVVNIISHSSQRQPVSGKQLWSASG